MKWTSQGFYYSRFMNFSWKISGVSHLTPEIMKGQSGRQKIGYDGNAMQSGRKSIFYHAMLTFNKHHYRIKEQKRPTILKYRDKGPHHSSYLFLSPSWLQMASITFHLLAIKPSKDSESFTSKLRLLIGSKHPRRVGQPHILKSASAHWPTPDSLGDSANSGSSAPSLLKAS
ncbi:hypothetical protein V2G26_016672 [Clonostachys chloroleuca]